MHLFYIPNEFTNAYIGSAAVLSWWKGDWQARAITACQMVIMAIGYFWTYGLHQPTDRPHWWWYAEDFVLLAACLAGVPRAKRYWPIWASSFALLILLTDLFMLIGPQITFWADLAASFVWNYLLTATILIGVWPSVRASRPGVTAEPASWPAPEIAGIDHPRRLSIDGDGYPAPLHDPALDQP